MRSVPLFSVTCIVLGSFYESRQLLLANNLISTVVGTGSPGFAGDGSFATSAKVNNPTGITSFDTNGNYYFADTYNNRVRMVSSSASPQLLEQEHKGFQVTEGQHKMQNYFILLVLP